MARRQIPEPFEQWDGRHRPGQRQFTENHADRAVDVDHGADAWLDEPDTAARAGEFRRWLVSASGALLVLAGVWLVCQVLVAKPSLVTVMGL